MHRGPAFDPSARAAPRWWIVLAAVLRLCAILAIFSASLIAGVALHMSMGVTRRTVRAGVNALLADALQGTVRLGAISRLSFAGIALGELTIDDPSGRRVLFVEGIQLDGPWAASALTLALSGGQGRLALPPLRIDRGELELVRDGDRLTLQTALLSKPKPRRPKVPPKPPSPSRFGMTLPDIAIGVVVVRGQVDDAMRIDGRVSDLRARLAVGPDGLALDVHGCSVEERGLLGVEVKAKLSYHLRHHSDDQGGASDMWGSFAGTLGTVELKGEVQWVGQRLAAAIELPRLEPHQLDRTLPGHPLRAALAARLWLAGTQDRLEAEGTIELDGVAGAAGGRLALSGSVRPGAVLLLDARLEARAFDVRALDVGGLAPQALATSVDATLRVRGRVSDRGAAFRVTLASAPARVGSETVPALEGTLLLSEAGGEALLRVHEPGAVSDADLRIDGDAELRFVLRAEVRDLTRVPRLREVLVASGAPPWVGGRLLLGSEGRIRGDHVDLSAWLDGENLTLPDPALEVGRARLRGRVWGRLDALEIEAGLDAARLRLAERDFASLHVGVSGPVRAPTVRALLRDHAERELEIRGVVEPSRMLAHSLAVELRRGTTTLSGRVERLVGLRDSLRIDGIALSGLGGQIDGELWVGRGELGGRLVGRELDLGQLSKLLGLPYRLRGRVGIDVDLQHDQEGRHGFVRIEVEKAGMLVIGGVDLSVNARFEGDRIMPEMRVALSSEPIAGVSAEQDPCAGRIIALTLKEAELTLAGRMLEVASWRDASGRATLVLDEAKLPCLVEIWQQIDPTRTLPLERVEGTLAGAVTFSRPSSQQAPVGRPTEWPSLEQVVLRSTGLELAAARGDEQAEPAWRSEHLDVDLRGSFDAATGEVHAELALLDRLTAGDELAALELDVTVDVEGLLAGGNRAPSALQQMPISAHVRVRRMPFGRSRALPEPLAGALAAAAGDIEINAYLQGTPRDPSLGFRVRTWDMDLSKRVHDWDLRTDLDVIGSYHGGIGRIDARVARGGRTVATVAGESTGDLVAPLIGGSDPRWTGWLEAKLLGLPLETLPLLSDAQISGELSGELAVHGLGRAPEVRASLSSPELRVGDELVLERPLFVVTPISGQPGALTLESTLPVRGGGRLQVGGYGSLRWEDQLYPRVDTRRPAALYVVADAFPVGVFKPLLGDEVNRLAGRLDGELRLAYHEFAERDLALDVDMTLSEGVLHVPAFGQELHDVGAHVAATPGLIRIDEITASSSGGKATGWLLARTRSDSLRLRDVTGAIVIHESEAMPLVIEGMPIGNVSGKLMLHGAISPSEEAGPATLDLKLTAAGLHIRLPPTPAHGVQALSDHPDVQISEPVAPPQVETPARTMPIAVTIVLADAEVEGSQLRVVFGTNPDRPVRISVDRDVSGELQLSGGEISLLDKTFTIDRGIVRLDVEDPGNPYVNVTAHWAAPEGTVVYVDYVGKLMPLTRDKIRFRSEPPRSEGELLALLVFGESQSSGRGGRENDRAGGLSRGIAASQFNAILGEVAPGLSTSLSSSEGYVSTTVTYRFSERVSASATYESVSQGAPASEQDPAAADTTTTQTNTGTETTSRTKLSVDWRFAPSWLLRGSFGLGEGASSGVDLLFQHRYQ